MLTLERVRETLHYNRKTGILTWRIARPGTRAGSVAGCSKDGYIVVRLDGVLYRAHRLIWFYVKGVWPNADIDHRDRVRNNNIWRNLRDTSRSRNLQNMHNAKTNNKLGILGVSVHKQSGKFRAAISIKGKQTHLGLFDTTKAASAAYWAAKHRHHAGFVQ